MDLTLSVVDAASAAPPVGAAEHRLGAVLAVDAIQLSRGEVEGVVPRQLHELVIAPTRIGTRPGL